MTELLNIRTLILAGGGSALVLCLCMTYVSSTRKVYPGFHLWTLGSLLLAVGSLLVALQGPLPSWVSLILGNALITSQGLLLVRGLADFAGVRQRNWRDASIIAGVLAYAIYFTYIHPSVNARIILHSAILSLLAWLGAWMVDRHVTKVLHGPNRLLSWSLTFISLWFALRAVGTWIWEPPLTSLIQGGVLQRVSLLVAPAVNIVLLTGLIILNAQRMEQDLISARQEAETLKGLLPICAHCKKIRDDSGFWNQVEEYIAERSEATFSHSICPECAKELYPGLDHSRLK